MQPPNENASRETTAWLTVEEVKGYNVGNSDMTLCCWRAQIIIIIRTIIIIILNLNSVHALRRDKTATTEIFQVYLRLLCQHVYLFKSVTKHSIDPENKLRTGFLRERERARDREGDFFDMWVSWVSFCEPRGGGRSGRQKPKTNWR